MSRGYRLRVRESLTRVTHVGDRAELQLELLNVLPAEQMAELLRDELLRRGFRPDKGQLVRQKDDITVSADPLTGLVRLESQKEVQATVTAQEDVILPANVSEDITVTKAKEVLRVKVLEPNLDKRLAETVAEARASLARQLEAELVNLRQELDQAVNRVTAEALKRRAAQLGAIKHITEDQASGSLTIVVEV
ncbi:MAG: hypothetical protein NZ700_02640 [Gemmataceae bacterium]|nr:hypothetical protein [Gemmataceae bacterium]MDW8264134.1 hypothetical protein [Gemmataceae bacterium]